MIYDCTVYNTTTAGELGGTWDAVQATIYNDGVLLLWLLLLQLLLQLLLVIRFVKSKTMSLICHVFIDIISYPATTFTTRCRCLCGIGVCG